MQEPDRLNPLTEGTNGNQRHPLVPIFLIVGAPAVGKSTTSRAIAARFPRSLHIPVDDIRDMVVSGQVLPSPAWNDDLVEQLNLARVSAAHMALAYHRAGFAVVIDDFYDPNHRSDYQALFALPHVHKVVLYPQQEEAHQRNQKRAGDSPFRVYIDEGIQLVYHLLNPSIAQLAQEGWLVVDTTTLSVDETVTTILAQTAVLG